MLHERLRLQDDILPESQLLLCALQYWMEGEPIWRDGVEGGRQGEREEGKMREREGGRERKEERERGGRREKHRRRGRYYTCGLTKLDEPKQQIHNCKKKVEV